MRIRPYHSGERIRCGPQYGVRLAAAGRECIGSVLLRMPQGEIANEAVSKQRGPTLASTNCHMPRSVSATW
jgi:hypothetical protein